MTDNIYGMVRKDSVVFEYICPFCGFKFKHHVGDITKTVVACPCCWNHINKTRGVKV